MTIDLGEDFSATDDMRADLGTVTGILVLEEAIYRRLNTPRGTLPPTLAAEPDPNDVDYGSDLAGMLHLASLPNGLFAIQAFVAGEVNKEDVVDPAQTVVIATVTGTGASASLEIAISGQSAGGPFALVVGVSAFASTAATISLLSSAAQR